jgi:hypothetical protein
MGRRTRTRAKDASAPDVHQPATPRSTRALASDALNPARRIIAAYLGGAALVGVLTLAGIAALGGVGGPFVTFAVVVMLSVALIRFAAARLEGLELTEEDRLMRLLATGVLLVACVLALVSAIVSRVVA